MKKLVYFSHGLSANGIETFLVNVLEKLDKTKYDVTVIIAIDEGVETLHGQRVRDMGVKVIHAGDLDSLKKKLEYIKNVKRELKSGDFDIAHSNMDLLNGITLFLAKTAGVKKRICHAHTSKSQYKAQGVLGKCVMLIQKAYAHLMKNLILINSTERLACSAVAGEYFYGTHSYKLIYNGINMERYQKSENFNYNDYSKQLGFSGDEKHRLVSVGRITGVKNPIFALEIISELKKIRNDFRYAWVGTGERENEVKAKIKELNLEDIVILTGIRTDIPQVLGCCDCFLMPSLFEGLPFSLVEAQAANLKCVVSDVVTKTADLGLITYVSLEKSAAEWAEVINGVLDRPTPEKDKQKAKLFDVSNTVRQLEEIYDK
ncbi:MAG: glycosyltransferase [Clostridia bacterium]|nr:glycosyltransferase [Clostridia bacterium]